MQPQNDPSTHHHHHHLPPALPNHQSASHLPAPSLTRTLLQSLVMHSDWWAAFSPRTLGDLGTDDTADYDCDYGYFQF